MNEINAVDLSETPVGTSGRMLCSGCRKRAILNSNGLCLACETGLERVDLEPDRASHEHTVSVDGRTLRPLGSHAMLGDIHCRVLAVQVQMGPRVVYNVSWALDGRKEEWVEACELKD